MFADMEAMPTSELLEALQAIDDAPWGDIRGKPLDARGLSNRLRRYGIRRRDIRVGSWHGKGYAREDLHEQWIRYLGSPKEKTVTSVTPVTTKAAPVALVTDVTDLREANPDLRCTYCGGSESADNPVRECHVGDQRAWLHRTCEASWL